MSRRRKRPIRERAWFRHTSFTLAALFASGCAEQRDAGLSQSVQAVGEDPEAGDGPPAFEAEVDPEEAPQANFSDPVTNTGAFTTQVPFDVPSGIRGMQPELALGYSHQGGLGLAGVGWDLSVPIIQLDTSDGARPRTLIDEAQRLGEDGAIVDRYVSPFGQIAVVRGATDSINDLEFVVHPKSGAEVSTVMGQAGEVEQFVVRTPDGRRYFFGTDAGHRVERLGPSMGRESDPNDRQSVMWLLERLEDAHGNVMRYHWEQTSSADDGTTALGRRQPILRAIEYGITADDTNAGQYYVVWFRYDALPRTHRNFRLGTHIDQWKLLRSVKVYAKASVSTVSNGYLGETHTLAGDIELVRDYQLSYAQDGDENFVSYSGRPLLTRVERIGAHHWSFNYKQPDMTWRDPFHSAIENGPITFDLGNDEPLSRATEGPETIVADLNADSYRDLLVGRTDGQFEVQWGGPDGFSAPELRAVPLAALDGVRQHAVPSPGWQGLGELSNFSLLDPPAGMAYAEALTAHPVPIDHTGEDTDYTLFWAFENGQLGTGIWSVGEEEDDPEAPLARGVYFSDTFTSPAPRILGGNTRYLFSTLVKYGAARDTYASRLNFDRRASDYGRGADDFELDHCWNINLDDDWANIFGSECFEPRAGRQLADFLESSNGAGSHTTQLWDVRDLNGDGLLDYLYSGHVIAQDDQGAPYSAVDDPAWFVALGNGDGFDPIQRWDFAALDGPDGQEVYGPEFIGIDVAAGRMTRAIRAGVSISVSAGFSGVSVGADLAIGTHSIPLASYGWGYGGGGSLSVLGGLNKPASFVRNLPRAIGTRLASAGYQAQGLNSTIRSALLPSASIGVSLTNADKNPFFFNLPVFGNLFSIASTYESDTFGYAAQGLYDVDGDGRDDYVVSTYRGEENPHFDPSDQGQTGHPEFAVGGPTIEDDWLVYRNNGAGFDAPQVWPTRGAYNNWSRERWRGVASTLNQTDTLELTFPDGDPGSIDYRSHYPFAHHRTEAAMVDLNGDGLLDRVVRRTDDPGDWWIVGFNTGDGFADPIHWSFPPRPDSETNDNTWYDRPQIANVVSGIDNPAVMSGHSRQVQALRDFNGDGLLDFYYEEPVNPDYDRQVPGAMGRRSTGVYYRLTRDLRCPGDGCYFDELSTSTSPNRVQRPVWVMLNNGLNGFEAPVAWVVSGEEGDDGNAPPLSSSRTIPKPSSVPSIVERHIGPSTQISIAQVGDLDQDGNAEIALPVSAPANDADGVVRFTHGQYELFPIEDATAEFMTQVVTPTGGRLNIEYTLDREANGDMPVGQWVVDTLSYEGPSEGPLYAEDNAWTRAFIFDHGVYNREERQFMGYERIYQYTPEGDGYTVSRYMLEPGLTGMQACREVRRLDGGTLDADFDPDRQQAPIEPVALDASASDLENELAADFDCAKADDPGTPLTMTRSVYGLDVETGADGKIYTQLLRAETQRAFRTNGDVDFDHDTLYFYDDQLRRIAAEDQGERAVADDTVLTRASFVQASANGVLLSSLPCTTAIYLEAFEPAGQPGDAVALTKRGYDGAPPNSCESQVPATGDLTTQAVRADAQRWLVDTYAYSDAGMLLENVRPDGVTAWTRYDSTFPWLTVAQGLRSAAGDERTLTEMERHGIHTPQSPAATGLFGQPFVMYDENGLALIKDQAPADGAPFGTQFAYDGTGRLTIIAKPGTDLITRSTTYTYTNFKAGVQPASVLTTNRLTLSGTPILMHARSFMDGMGRTARVHHMPPVGQNRWEDTVVALRKAYDRSGRVRYEYEPYMRSAEAPYAAGDEEPQFDADRAPAKMVTEYDGMGRVARVRAWTGFSTTHTHDGRFLQRQGPMGEFEQDTIDARGRVSESLRQYTTANGGGTMIHMVRTAFDHADRVVQRTDGDGNPWTWTYDQAGRLTLFSDPNGTPEYTRYNGLGQMAARFDLRLGQTGHARAYSYDGFGRLERIEDYVNASVDTDGLVTGGLMVARTDFEYGTAADDCNRVGRVKTISHSQRFDAASALDVVSQKDYCYSPGGVVKALDHTILGELYQWTYDLTVSDQVRQTTYPDGTQVTFAFDEHDGLIDRTLVSNGSLQANPILAHDVTARMPGGLVTRAEMGEHLARVRCYSPTRTDPRSQHRTMIGFINTVDQNDDPTPDEDFAFQCAHTPGNTSGYDLPISGYTAYQWVIGRDASSRVTSRSIEANPVVQGNPRLIRDSDFQYNELGWLLREEHVINGGNPTGQNYRYDRLGNLIRYGNRQQNYGGPARAGVANAGPNAIKSSGNLYDFRYDEAGNVSRWSSGDHIVEYEWLPNGRIGRMTSSYLAQSFDAEYVYDETGARVAELRNDRTRVMSEGLWSATIAPSGYTTREAVIPGIGVRRSDVLASGTALDGELYIAGQDGVNSNVALLTLEGAVTDLSMYNAWGDIENRVTAQNSHRTDLLYSSQERQRLTPMSIGEQPTDIYNHGARQYFADVGRWLSLDPLMVDGLNRYAYVRNNPVSGIDSTGLSDETNGRTRADIVQERYTQARNFIDDPEVNKALDESGFSLKPSVTIKIFGQSRTLDLRTGEISGKGIKVQSSILGGSVPQQLKDAFPDATVSEDGVGYTVSGPGVSLSVGADGSVSGRVDVGAGSVSCKAGECSANLRSGALDWEVATNAWSITGQVTASVGTDQFGISIAFGITLPNPGLRALIPLFGISDVIKGAGDTHRAKKAEMGY
jgi:RHS repeat-associated protein